MSVNIGATLKCIAIACQPCFIVLMKNIKPKLKKQKLDGQFTFRIDQKTLDKLKKNGVDIAGACRELFYFLVKMEVNEK